MPYLARVYVTLKPVVNDPQGLTIRGALHDLGFSEVESVRAGKYLELQLRAGSEQEAARRVDEMCRLLLANTVIEDYRFSLEKVGEG
ncbi:MAG: phosphoribosylformylglycinamidine synthase subunit PurS [Dehalococcoidia bacterium]|jgi:phosphoribosylformylglycinamidine synthase|nr:phosphoribosylformylglycinamidine synthase subunit PurS [Dehalococcoidia bacterium]MDW8008815.1 phosphoribosylformylglycinamidine synthase subunit PurS [Chloroflexota bacterium]